MSYKPLNSTQTGHTGDLEDTQTPVRGSQEVVTPRPVQGPNSWEADMTQPAQEFDLPVVIMPQPAWGSAH